MPTSPPLPLRLPVVERVKGVLVFDPEGHVAAELPDETPPPSDGASPGLVEGSPADDEPL